MEIRSTFHYRGKEYDLEEAESLLIDLETSAESIELDRQARGEKRRTMTPEDYTQWSHDLNTSWIVTRKMSKRLRLWITQSKRMAKVSKKLRTNADALNAEEYILVNAFDALRQCYLGADFTYEHLKHMDALRDLLRAKDIDVENFLFNARTQARAI